MATKEKQLRRGDDKLRFGVIQNGVVHDGFGKHPFPVRCTMANGGGQHKPVSKPKPDEQKPAGGQKKASGKRKR